MVIHSTVVKWLTTLERFLAGNFVSKLQYSLPQFIHQGATFEKCRSAAFRTFSLAGTGPGSLTSEASFLTSFSSDIFRATITKCLGLHAVQAALGKLSKLFLSMIRPTLYNN